MAKGTGTVTSVDFSGTCRCVILMRRISPAAQFFGTSPPPQTLKDRGDPLSSSSTSAASSSSAAPATTTTVALASQGSDSEVVAELVTTLRSQSAGLNDGTLTLTLDVGRLCTAINVVHRAFRAAERDGTPLPADALALVSLLAGLQNLQLDAMATLTTRFPRAASSSSLIPPLFPSLRILRLKGRVSERLGAVVRANCRHSLQELVIIDAAADGRAPPGEASLELSALLSDECKWPLVKRLFIRRCGLSTCRGALRALPNVRAIDLQHNALTQLCAAQHNYALVTLDLGFNRIASLEGANRVLGNIQTLVLSFNCVQSTAGIDKLYGLRSLDLRSNLIGTLAEVTRLKALPVLEELAVAGNPVCSMPQFRRRVVAAFVGASGVDASLRTLDGEGVGAAGVKAQAQRRALAEAQAKAAQHSKATGGGRGRSHQQHSRGSREQRSLASASASASASVLLADFAPAAAATTAAAANHAASSAARRGSGAAAVAAARRGGGGGGGGADDSLSRSRPGAAVVTGTFASAQMSPQCKVVVRSPHKRSGKKSGKRSGKKSGKKSGRSRSRIRADRAALDSEASVAEDGKAFRDALASAAPALVEDVDAKQQQQQKLAPPSPRSRTDTTQQNAALLGSEFIVERWSTARDAWEGSMLEIKQSEFSELSFAGATHATRKLRQLVGLRQPSDTDEPQLLLEWDSGEEISVLYRLSDADELRRLYDLLRKWVGRRRASTVQAQDAAASASAALRHATTTKSATGAASKFFNPMPVLGETQRPAARGTGSDAESIMVELDGSSSKGSGSPSSRTQQQQQQQQVIPRRWSTAILGAAASDGPSALKINALGGEMRWMGPASHANLEIDSNLELYFRNYYAANSARRIRGLADLVHVAKVAVMPVSFGGTSLVAHNPVEEVAIALITERKFHLVRSAPAGKSNGTFRSAPLFEIIYESSIECLSRVSMGFNALKMYMQFNGARDGAAARWCLITRCKETTYTLLQRLRAVASGGFEIANVDAATLSAIHTDVFESSVEAPALYLLLFERRRGRQNAQQRFLVPRTLVVSAARVYLCDENHCVADPTGGAGTGASGGSGGIIKSGSAASILRKVATASIVDVVIELERATTHCILRCGAQRWALTCERPSDRDRIKSTIERLVDDAGERPRLLGKKSSTSRMVGTDVKSMFS